MSDPDTCTCGNDADSEGSKWGLVGLAGIASLCCIGPAAMAGGAAVTGGAAAGAAAASGGSDPGLLMMALLVTPALALSGIFIRRELRTRSETDASCAVCDNKSNTNEGASHV